MNRPWSQDIEQAALRTLQRYAVKPRIVFLGAARSGKSALIQALFGFPSMPVESSQTRRHEPSVDERCIEILECPGYGTPCCSVDDAVDLASDACAHLMVHVLNGAGTITREDVRLRRKLPRQCPGWVITVFTKADMLDGAQVERHVSDAHSLLDCTDCFVVSAKEGTNLPALAGRMAQVLPAAVQEGEEEERTADEHRLSRRVRWIVYSSASVCATVAATPVPFADMAAILPVQVAMIVQIGRTYGLTVSPKQVIEVMEGLGFTVGAGLLFRSGARQLRRMVPGATAVDAAVAFAGTVALGHAAARWCRHRGRDSLYQPRPALREEALQLSSPELPSVSLNAAIPDPMASAPQTPPAQ